MLHSAGRADRCLPAVVRALATIHAADILYYHLRPANLLLEHERMTVRVHRVGGFGMANLNTEPSPGTDSTHMRPPCCSTMRLHNARPMPVPG